MKRSGLGLLQYVQDYDEQTPASWRGVDTAGPCDSWRKTIQPYIKSEAIFFCPSHSLGATNRWTSSLSVECQSGLASYGLNLTHYDVGTPNPPASDGSTLRSLASITNPASTIWIAEYTGGRAFGTVDSAGNYNGDNALTHDPLGYKTASQRHSEGANYLWCDGHVKWLRPTMVDEPTPTLYGDDYSPWSVE